MELNEYPTLFRGVSWDDGWEFDCPSIVIGPYQRYGIGGNIHHFVSMVEDICIDLSIDKDAVSKTFCKSDLKEFAWRGWSAANFHRRREAWHLEATVLWREEDDEARFTITEARERWGLAGEWEVFYRERLTKG